MHLWLNALLLSAAVTAAGFVAYGGPAWSGSAMAAAVALLFVNWLVLLLGLMLDNPPRLHWLWHEARVRALGGEVE